ncbi:hypothetical protein GC176_04855 [bacterium]|nr:hypothetical protein [bacterium]
MSEARVFRGIVRWSARLAGALSVGTLLYFVIAHLMNPDDGGPGPTPSEWFGLTFFPAGVIIGLALAFFRPTAGALLALGSLAIFYLWHIADRGHFPTGVAFFVFTSPAILFLVSSLLDARAASHDESNRYREPGPSKGTQ